MTMKKIDTGKYKNFRQFYWRYALVRIGLVWAIYDIIKHRSGFEKKIHQGLWLMVVVFLPILGSVTYLSVRNSVRPR